MRKARRKIDRGIKAPLLGMGVMIASALCFLLFLCLLIILVRLIIGNI